MYVGLTSLYHLVTETPFRNLLTDTLFHTLSFRFGNGWTAIPASFLRWLGRFPFYPLSSASPHLYERFFNVR